VQRTIEVPSTITELACWTASVSRRLAVCAVAGASLCLAMGFVPAGADPAGPAIAARSPFAIRGDLVDVELTGLSDGVAYTATTSGGDFQATGSTSVIALGDSTGAAQLTLANTSAVPATTSSITLSLSEGGSVVSSDSVPFAVPEMSIADLCPVSSATLTGRGFADGDYAFTGGHVSFSPSDVHVSGGTLPAVSVASDGGLPASYSVTASIAGTTTVVGTAGQQRRVGFLTENDNGYTPWRVRYDGTCFAPGEQVTISARSSQASGTTVTTDSHGRFQATVALHPATAARGFAGVDAHGKTSGQTGRGALNGPVDGTTLLAGQTLHPVLVSPNPGYVLYGGCNPRIEHVYANGGGTMAWAALTGDGPKGVCTLTLRTDGDLVDRSSTGKLLWHTGTAGTGSHNRLSLLSNGNLVLRNYRGTELWSSASGRAGDPAKATLTSGHRLLPGKQLVRGAWALTLRHSGDLVLTQSGRVKWHSKTAGRRGTHLDLRANGDLVLYRTDRRAVWSARTRAGSGARLVLQDAGNLVLYTRVRTAIWSTRTGE
jgi:hypothetical protein